MPSKDELLERLEELDVPQNVIDGFRTEFDSSGLRKKIGEYERRWKEEAEPAIDYRRRQETLPKRKEALRLVGVNYDAEPQYGQETLDSIPDDKLDNTEWLAEFVKSKGFRASLQSEEEPREKSGAEKITDFLTNAGPGAPVKAGVVTPATFASWDMGKRRDFMKKHPQAFDALSRGEEATV